MKRIIPVLFCLLFSSVIISQNREYYSGHELVDKFNELQSEITEAISGEDYKSAEIRAFEAINFFSTLPPEIRNKYRQILANNYYHLACIYSLQKDNNKAITSFEKAIDLGFLNYAHARKDTDLDYIRNEKQFKALMDKVRPLGDYQYILKQDGEYIPKDNQSSFPRFVYETASSKNLQKVREYFNLDSIAGSGDEVSKMINVMTWVHNSIPHHGNGWPVSELDAIDIYNYSKANNKALNCKAISIVLNECYLSMGFKSRIVACYPKNEDDFESHVINTVFSRTLNKWLWMDATFNAYLEDDNGNLLSIAEVRESLINDSPLILNEDANWNNISWNKEQYFDNYMTRFLYWFRCPVRSVFNAETEYRETNVDYISLMPVGYDNVKRETGNNYTTNDSEYFWQNPDMPE